MKNLYTILIALLLSSIVSGQWVQQTAGVIPDVSFRHIVFNDIDNGWIITGGESPGIYTTNNGGVEWLFCIDFLFIFPTSNSEGTSISFPDINNGWIYNGIEMLRTSNGTMGCETNWTMLDTIGYGYPTLFFIDSLNGWLTYYVDMGSDVFYTYFYHTNDGGNNWISDGMLGEKVTKIFFIDTQTGWATDKRNGYSGFLRTDDGGVTWNKINSIKGTSVYFTDSQKGWITGYYDEKGVWYTSDGGYNWVQQVGDTIPQLNDITFSDELNGWAVGDSGTILHTSDGGQNWEYQESGTLAHLNSVCFIDQNMGWICGDSLVILHTDNGGIVGIEDPITELVSLNIYPNPTHSSITIELPTQPSKNTSLTISNTNGQQLITQAITEPQTEIDISSLPTGIYIFKVWNDKDVMVQKVIKQ